MPPKRGVNRSSLSYPSHLFTCEVPICDSNADKGVLVLPPEMLAQVLGHFKQIHIYTFVDHISAFVFPPGYTERPALFRSLSQVCRSYRAVFLPLVYESLDTCLHPSKKTTADFYQHATNTLERKCAAILAYPEVCTTIGYVERTFLWNDQLSSIVCSGHLTPPCQVGRQRLPSPSL